MIDLPEFFGAHPVLFFVLLGIFLPYMMAVTAITFAKAGRSPFWCFLLATPVTAIIVLWWFAYAKWPSLKEHHAPSDISEKKTIDD